ncbi:MAG: hypothetical protein KAV87_55460 [Desulfobacteraceae bacterium]|nr:hypothetical protein [Desulfobacteraceae bacterium]
MCDYARDCKNHGCVGCDPKRNGNGCALADVDPSPPDKTIDELSREAAILCIGIYKKFSEEEVACQPVCIASSWMIGYRLLERQKWLDKEATLPCGYEKCFNRSQVCNGETREGCDLRFYFDKPAHGIVVSDS